MVDSERSESEECASDLAFDQLLGGELSAERARAIESHLETCAVCRARFEELERFRDQARLPEFGRLREPPASSRPRSAWFAAAGAVLAAAAALVLWLRAPIDPEGEETRVKGSGKLSFYVKRGESVTRGGPGEVLHPGDAVEFAYTAPRSGFLVVLSVDGSGRASAYFPTGERAVPVSAGEQVMPGSTLLDDVLGPETFYGVFCDAAIEIEPLRARLEREPRVLPSAPGCQVDSLAVEKR
jgi:hypothetical protein